jgi:TATA-binding protein-associated factor Taf7
MEEKKDLNHFAVMKDSTELYGEMISPEETLTKSIEALKTQLKHSRNPLEQRQIRQKIGKMERELKYIRQH